MLGWAIFQVIIFVVVIGILKHILYSDTRSALGRLKLADEEIKQRKEELTKKERNLEEEYEKKVVQGREELKKLKREAIIEAERLREEILDKAQSESNEIIKAAHSSHERLRQEIFEELRKESLELSYQLIKELFSHKHLEELNQGLIEEVINQLENVKEADLSSSFEKVEIIYNFPLKASQKEKISEIISKKVSHPIELVEKKDDSLISGVMIKLGSLVMDGALSSCLREAQESLSQKKQAKKVDA